MLRFYCAATLCALHIQYIQWLNNSNMFCAHTKWVFAIDLSIIIIIIISIALLFTSKSFGLLCIMVFCE